MYNGIVLSSYSGRSELKLTSKELIPSDKPQLYHQVIVELTHKSGLHRRPILSNSRLVLRFHSNNWTHFTTSALTQSRLCIVRVLPHNSVVWEGWRE